MTRVKRLNKLEISVQFGEINQETIVARNILDTFFWSISFENFIKEADIIR
jgi:hypothetical protein